MTLDEANLVLAYRILGLTGTDASPSAILAAYRLVAADRASRYRHPDLGGTVEGFRDLTEARDLALQTAREAPCPTCAGVGRVVEGGTGFGASTVYLQCLRCGGTKLRWSG